MFPGDDCSTERAFGQCLETYRHVGMCLPANCCAGVVCLELGGGDDVAPLAGG